MTVIHTGRPDDPILMVSYFKLNQGCAYKSCGEPVTEVRVTLTSGAMLIASTICSKHVASEREALGEVADEIKAPQDPNRN